MSDIRELNDKLMREQRELAKLTSEREDVETYLKETVGCTDKDLENGKWKGKLDAYIKELEEEKAELETKEAKLTAEAEELLEKAGV